VDLVFLLLAMAVVAGAVAVAMGRVRGGLEPPTSNLPDLGLPAGELQARDVDDVRFSLGLRGYRMDQVDAVLERLRGELAGRDAEIAAMRARVDQDARQDSSEPAAELDGQRSASVDDAEGTGQEPASTARQEQV